MNEATTIRPLLEQGMEFDQAYEIVHGKALQKYDVSPFSVIHPSVLDQFKSFYNGSWFNFWGKSK